MVTARFKVTRVTPHGAETIEDAYAAEVEMTPDYADGENADWASATPSGVFRMTVSNKGALEQLKQGKSVHIEITPQD